MCRQLDYSKMFEIPRGVSESKRTKNKPKMEMISIAKSVCGSTQLHWQESMKIADKVSDVLNFTPMYPKDCRGVSVEKKTLKCPPTENYFGRT